MIFSTMNRIPTHHYALYFILFFVMVFLYKHFEKEIICFPLLIFALMFIFRKNIVHFLKTRLVALSVTGPGILDIDS